LETSITAHTSQISMSRSRIRRGQDLAPTKTQGSYSRPGKTPLDAQNIINRHFKPLPERPGLPPIRWHDLRHTYATLLLARGTHPTYVQKSLGHASVQLTLDRCSHWMPSMGRNTAEGIDEALG
jgi:integrase